MQDAISIAILCILSILGGGLGAVALVATAIMAGRRNS